MRENAFSRAAPISALFETDEDFKNTIGTYPLVSECINVGILLSFYSRLPALFGGVMDTSERRILKDKRFKGRDRLPYLKSSQRDG